MLGCVNNILEELNKRWSESTGIEDPVWKFCDEYGIKKIILQFLIKKPDQYE